MSESGRLIICAYKHRVYGMEKKNKLFEAYSFALYPCKIQFFIEL